MKPKVHELKKNKLFSLNKPQFLLDPNITFLNHGSFGSYSKPIFEEYQRFQRELENDSVSFFTKINGSYSTLDS